jgi:hypothetical protein
VSAAQVPVAVRRLFPKPGVDLLSDLGAIVGGETALYARPGGEITLVTSPSDVRAAEQALADVGVKLHHAAIGGQLVLSTTAGGIAAFRGSGRKLSADEGFRHAGLPARASAFAYVRAPFRGLRPLAAWTAADGRDDTLTVRFLRGSR